jgi:exopolysaccharide biosynthesis polyprenyl glycosylphosphotransferase
MTVLPLHASADSRALHVTRAGAGDEYRHLRRLLVASDTAALVVGWVLALAQHEGRLGDRASLVFIIVAAGLLLCHWQGLYRARTCALRTAEVSRILRVGAILALVAVVLDASTDAFSLSSTRAIAGAAISSVLLAAGRGWYRSWLRSARRAGKYLRGVVIVGTNTEALHLAKVLATHPETGYEVMSVVGDPAPYAELDFPVPCLGDVGDALGVISGTEARGAIIAASSITPAQLNALVRALLDRGVHVQLSTGIQGISQTRLTPSPLAHEPVFYIEPLRLSAAQEAVKRALDIGVATVLLILAVPALALAAAAIKFDSRGPVLFRQRRPGRGGVPFEILKLRTMTVGAERLEPLVSDDVRGPRAKVDTDPRRTRVGRVLERTSIDELPQLLNVLKGDMSIVGPRPALLHEASRFDPQLQRRHDVRPGITGLWQVEARDNPAFEAYRRYDLFYIENWSFSLDLAILLATAQTVALRGLSALRRLRPGAKRPPVVVLDR